jgi:hypothetical protein
MTCVFGQEEQASLYFLWCAFFNDFLNTSTASYKQVNLVEMAEKRKCDNNGDSSSSDQNRAHKTRLKQHWTF